MQNDLILITVIEEEIIYYIVLKCIKQGSIYCIALKLYCFKQK